MSVKEDPSGFIKELIREAEIAVQATQRKEKTIDQVQEIIDCSIQKIYPLMENPLDPWLLCYIDILNRMYAQLYKDRLDAMITSKDILGQMDQFLSKLRVNGAASQSTMNHLSNVGESSFTDASEEKLPEHEKISKEFEKQIRKKEEKRKLKEEKKAKKEKKKNIKATKKEEKKKSQEKKSKKQEYSRTQCIQSFRNDYDDDEQLLLLDDVRSRSPNDYQSDD